MKNLNQFLLMFRFVLVLVFVLSTWQITNAQGVFTYPDIITSLNTRLPNQSFKNKTELIKWLIAEIKKNKVDKPLTQDIEDILRQAGATDELIETIRRNSPIMSNPDAPIADIDFYITLGVTHANKNEFDKAIAEYNKALKINPRSDVTLVLRGYAYGSKNEIDKAFADFNKALEINPKNDMAYARRGIVYTNNNDFDKALADFQKAIEIDPKNDLAYSSRGYLYYNKSKFDEALTDYNKAIEINPYNNLAWQGRGNVYLAKNEFDKAITDFTKALEINPIDLPSYVNRGLAFEKKGEYDKAIADFRRALASDPYNPRARDGLERIKQKQEK